MDKFSSKDCHINVIERIKRAFTQFGCSQLSDAGGKYVKHLDLQLKARTLGRSICGPVFPLITDNDMLPCLQALSVVSKGHILYIQQQAGKDEAEGLVGSIYATASHQQGIGGIIVEGNTRDTIEIEEMDIPIFSKGLNCYSSKLAKKQSKKIPCPVQIRNFTLNPGDWIFGDPDGFILIEPQHLNAVFEAAKILSHIEQEFIEKLSSGETFSDLVGLGNYLEGKSELKFSF